MADSGRRTTADTTAMGSAVVHVDNCHQALMSIMTQVNDAMQQTHGGYETAGAALFYDCMGQWQADFNKILAKLADIREMLSHTQAHYSSAMDIDHMSVNQVAALLNGSDV